MGGIATDPHVATAMTAVLAGTSIVPGATVTGPRDAIAMTADRVTMSPSSSGAVAQTDSRVPTNAPVIVPTNVPRATLIAANRAATIAADHAPRMIGRGLRNAKAEAVHRPAAQAAAKGALRSARAVVPAENRHAGDDSFDQTDGQ